VGRNREGGMSHPYKEARIFPDSAQILKCKRQASPKKGTDRTTGTKKRKRGDIDRCIAF